MAHPPRIKRIKDVLARLAPLAPLADTAGRLTRAERAVKGLLPSMLADYCRVRSVDDDELTLEAYSQAVATHLRFSTPVLISRLQRLDDFKTLETITVKVITVPQENRTKASRRPPATISDSSLAALRETAKSLSSESLGRALQGLADTLQTQQNNKKTPD